MNSTCADRRQGLLRSCAAAPWSARLYKATGVASEAFHVVPQKMSSRMTMITSSVTMPPPMYITAPFVVAIRGLLLLPYPLL